MSKKKIAAMIVVFALILFTCLVSYALYPVLKNRRLLDEEGLKAIKPENIILLGEAHWNREMLEFEFEFLKFLNKNYGFRDVVKEWAKSYQYYVDKCLETSDENFELDGFLGVIYEKAEGFLRMVREYNKDQKPEKRIRVWCGDIDHSNIQAMGRIVSYANRIEKGEVKKEILNFTEEFSIGNIPEDRAPFLEELGNASKEIRGMMEENRNLLPGEEFR